MTEIKTIATRNATNQDKRTPHQACPSSTKSLTLEDLFPDVKEDIVSFVQDLDSWLQVSLVSRDWTQACSTFQRFARNNNLWKNWTEEILPSRITNDLLPRTWYAKFKPNFWKNFFKFGKHTSDKKKLLLKQKVKYDVEPEHDGNYFYDEYIWSVISNESIDIYNLKSRNSYTYKPKSMEYVDRHFGLNPMPEYPTSKLYFCMYYWGGRVVEVACFDIEEKTFQYITSMDLKGEEIFDYCTNLNILTFLTRKRNIYIYEFILLDAKLEYKLLYKVKYSRLKYINTSYMGNFQIENIDHNIMIMSRKKFSQFSFFGNGATSPEYKVLKLKEGLYYPIVFKNKFILYNYLEEIGYEGMNPLLDGREYSRTRERLSITRFFYGHIMAIATAGDDILIYSFDKYEDMVYLDSGNLIHEIRDNLPQVCDITLHFDGQFLRVIVECSSEFYIYHLGI